MRIEEKCGCGAEIKLLVDQTIGRQLREERQSTINAAWKQIDRWRKLHAGCRAPFQATYSQPHSTPPLSPNQCGSP